MIIGRMLRKDFLRKKLITIVVFAFIFLSALLAASGSNLIIELGNSLNALFTRANTPHFVQMHAGPLDQAEIDNWAAANELVTDQQTVEMITVDGSNLTLGESGSSEENSIMDISFVTQNEGFDFLLDLDNNIIQLSPGEIAVPVYYSQERDLAVGDEVRVKAGAGEMIFTITTFSRDSQMNPAIASSKRFLIHEQDYASLRESIADTEYLVEFLLVDDSQIGAFASAYQAADLPQTGPAVDKGLFRIINSLSDGLVAGIVILMSLLLIVIAILSLRFTLLATIEEDTKEIGVMKAIGIARADIKRVYLAKYVVMGAAAALLGYLTSLLLSQVLSTNVLLYIGRASKSALQTALPLAAAFSIFLIVTVSCAVILRRFNRISAVEALRSGSVGESIGRIPMLNLKRGRKLNINAYLGVRDVLQRSRLYGLLAFVFFFCAVIIIIPIHFLTTIQSPTFISYMGMGRSDMRIDLRQSEDVADRFDSVLATLMADPDVAKLSPLVTSQFTVMQSDGTLETLNIETGDFSLFPLDYVQGTAPQEENEIALSYLNAGEMEKQIGDTVTLVDRGLVDRGLASEGQERAMVVSGIYQDITNGGRTAKATLPYNPQTVLWYTINLDLVPDANIEEKVAEYSQIFDQARVTDTASFISQTVGNTVQQLKTVTMVTVVVGLAVSVLITSLFMMMLIAKDSNQIAIMRSLGFSLRHIRTQYLTRALFLLAFGIMLGTLFSNTLGQQLVSVILSLQGASRIRFVIDPLQAYVMYPLLLMFTVAVTTILSTRTGIKETNIAEMIME